MKVLLVEDNFIASLDIKEQLTALGCEVLGPFAGVEDTLKLLDTSTPDGAYWADNAGTPYGAPVAGNNFAADTIADTGGGGAHNDMQPFTTLAFCIALQGLFPSRN